jgi:tetratricopeptide (TPR) repeat protein
MTRVTTVLGAIALATLAAGPAAAQDHHAAHAAEKLGTVHFPTSCAPRVAPQFDRAVALLHSFEFGASLRAFGEVLAADSTCAMAQWGRALSRWSNPMAAGNRAPAQLAEGRRFADEAARLAEHASERERGYITAVGYLYRDYEHVDQPTRVAEYERAMADLVARQPADTEAKIFHAIALVATAEPTDKSYVKRRQAGAVLESLWVKQPDHPGLAHYIIHTYDIPALAPLAAAAARRYAEIAPTVAHAQHMPSHTFTRLGYWNASARANSQSREAAIRDSALGEALHASDYMEYAYLQMRRVADARAVRDGTPALAARYDPTVVRGAAPPSAAFFAIAAIPARYALERHAWGEAVGLTPKATAFPHTEAITYFARALGAAHLKQLSLARASVDSLAAIAARLSARNEPYWAEQVQIQRLGAQAWLDLAEGREADALAHMTEAANREDATDKDAVTPGPLAPARELLGDMLMELRRPKEALAAYQATLSKEPNRYRALDGARRAATDVGDKRAAAIYAGELAKLTGRLTPSPAGSRARE